MFFLNNRHQSNRAEIGIVYVNHIAAGRQCYDRGVFRGRRVINHFDDRTAFRLECNADWNFVSSR